MSVAFDTDFETIADIIRRGEPIWLVLLHVSDDGWRCREIDGAGYARMDISDALAINETETEIKTTAAIEFGPALSDWGEISAFRLIGAEGQMLCESRFSSPHREIFAGNSFILLKGNLGIRQRDWCGIRLLDRRSIEIRPFLSHRSTVDDAWVFRDLAVHRCMDDPALWQITILPLGMCLAIDWCAFDRFQQAVAAMMEIAALRNDWHVIRQADLTKELEAKMKAIAMRHGAPERWEVGACGLADRNKFGRVMAERPNGYGAALDV